MLSLNVAAPTSRDFQPESSFSALKWHFVNWKVQGCCPMEYTGFKKILYSIHVIIYQFLMGVYYPVSLVIGLFFLESLQEVLENIAVTFTEIILTTKCFFVWMHHKRLYKIAEISRELDKKARLNKDEQEILNDYLATYRRYLKIYFISYSTVDVLAGISILMYTEKRLFYPAYLPFDWKSNNFLYFIAVFYQYGAWSLQVCENLFIDTYPGIVIHLLSSHLKVLSLRISKIGHNKEDTHEKSHSQLKEAIKDHKTLLEMFDIVQNAISPGLFGQFIVTVINVVTCILLVFFFVTDVYQQAYFITITIAYIMEIWLACYYGSQYLYTASNVHYAIYSSLWYEQTSAFKKDLIIFSENSLKEYTFMAGGLITVSLQSFMSIMKTTYSTFTVFKHMTK
ncbi:Or59a.2 family protein [Megaselia abdita]